MYKKLTKAESGRLEQRTLKTSLYTLVFLAFAGLAYGLYLGSDVIILDGIFTLVSLIGSGLYLLAAKLVARPPDRHFQYGYAHVEPMVNSINALMLLVICIYGFFVGLEAIRHGGHEVDYVNLIIYNLGVSAVAAGAWIHESLVARRIDSQLLRNNSREWIISLSFSLVTTLAFALMFVLPERLRAIWILYADSALVTLMSLLFLPVPIKILNHNIRELLMMTNTADVLVGRIEATMQQLQAGHDISSYSTHVVKIGRIHFIEISMVVGPAFKPRSVPELDQLRAQVLAAVDRPLDEVWLSIMFTANPSWA